MLGRNASPGRSLETSVQILLQVAYSISKMAQAPLRNPGMPAHCCAILSPSPGLFPLPEGQREAPGAGGPLSPCLTSDPSPLGLTQAPGHKETTTSPKTGKKRFNKYKNLQ